ncbi:hypothetical protein DFJ77DRAFT_472189 [Powellomyces hirtus]|nr:hypothetical protein DFJ77DRAFT_472189 [Powellomyces hirtus]
MLLLLQLPPPPPPHVQQRHQRHRPPKLRRLTTSHSARHSPSLLFILLTLTLTFFPFTSAQLAPPPPPVPPITTIVTEPLPTPIQLPQPQPPAFPQGGPCASDADCLVSPGSRCAFEVIGNPIGACRVPLVTTIRPVVVTSTRDARPTAAAGIVPLPDGDTSSSNHMSSKLPLWAFITIGIVSAIVLAALGFGLCCCLNLCCFAGRSAMRPKKSGASSLRGNNAVNSSTRNILPHNLNDTNDSLSNNPYSSDGGVLARAAKENNSQDMLRYSTKVSTSSTYRHHDTMWMDPEQRDLPHHPRQSHLLAPAAEYANLHHGNYSPSPHPAAAAASPHHHLAASPLAAQPPHMPPIIPAPATTDAGSQSEYADDASDNLPHPQTDMYPTPDAPCEFGYWDAQRRFHQGFTDEEGDPHRGYWDAQGKFWRVSLPRDASAGVGQPPPG